MIRPADPLERNFVRSSWLRSYASSEMALLCTPHDGASADVPDARKHTTKCSSCGAHSLRSDERNGFTHYRVGRTYREGQAKLIDALLERCNVSVYVGDDAPMVYGWIVREDVRPVLHYVYVQWSAREAQLGTSVARTLVADLADQPTRYTHKSRAVRPARLPAGWTFDPYALMGVT